MTTPNDARYHFRSWVRRGVGADAGQPDGPGLPDRAQLAVALNLTAVQGTTKVSDTPAPQMTVHLYGPGDVIGIDPRHVIRTEPRDLTMNFEPNYLAGIEFDHPDFPWLFTPALPKADRLRPFVALIALKDGEFSTPNVVPNPLPVIDVTTLSALQALDDAWNWAHAQISGDTDLTTTISGNPAAAASRLLCPRRLDPETGYTAFLVPAFEIGRQAGLGMDVSGIHTADPAWTSQTTAPLRIPVYYRFTFRTSDAGDFESLVRKLKPAVLPPDVGSAPMAVDQPAGGVPSAGGPLGLEGALRSAATVSTPWSGPDHDAFQAALQDLVNLAAASPADDPDNPAAADPHVVPPFYGKWHAAAKSLDRTQPGWLADLNLDPRNRTAAGMGTRIVQSQRVALMASAWDQVAGVDAANELLRTAQLGRAALSQLWSGHLAIASAATLVSLTAPVHARILDSGTSQLTVFSTLAASRVPRRLVSGAYRRVARPLGPLGRRATALAGLAGPPAARVPLIERINADAVRIAPPPPPLPGGMISIDAAGTAIQFAGLTAAAIKAAPPVRAFAVTVPPTGLGGPLRTQPLPTAGPPPAPSPVASGPPVDTPDAVNFRIAAAASFAAVHAAPADPPLAAALDIPTLSATVLSRLNPAATVPARMASIIQMAGGAQWFAPDPIEPIMAAPTFPQPMYVPLRDLSQDYLLPGAGLIPPDTLGAVVANHAFIESYMVGLNHEMARQLLWNGYPTDQRGSYFRQFWDVSGYLPQTGDPTGPAQLAEALKDIPPINTWPRSTSLGGNENQSGVVADNVVLLVRGELLRRYPNTVIFAGKAMSGTTGDNGRVLDETDERFPIFRGTLSPDITFLGFNLAVADARGGTAASPLGFFFVFQQQPTEPRFGLEPDASGTVTRWEDLAWTSFAKPSQVSTAASLGSGQGTLPSSAVSSVFPELHPTEVARYRVSSTVFAGVLAANAIPDFLTAANGPAGVALDSSNVEDAALAWGKDGAQTAAITLRMPFRIMVHADSLLP
jgi:hypothetical protein